MGEIILLFILGICLYEVGKAAGEKQTFETIRDYIKGSKDWDEVLKKLTKDWEEYDIEV